MSGWRLLCAGLLCVSLIGLAAIAPALAAAPGAVTGKAFVVDGNVITVHGEKLRLFGMDAPDRAQVCATAKGAAYPCGLRAAFTLDSLVKGKLVQCEPKGIGADMLVLATCSLSGLDIASAMIESGWATASALAPQYAQTEGAARAAKVGLWAGAFEPPTAWRREHPAASPPA